MIQSTLTVIYQEIEVTYDLKFDVWGAEVRGRFYTRPTLKAMYDLIDKEPAEKKIKPTFELPKVWFKKSYESWSKAAEHQITSYDGFNRAFIKPAFGSRIKEYISDLYLVNEINQNIINTLKDLEIQKEEICNKIDALEEKLQHPDPNIVPTDNARWPNHGI